MPVHLINHQRRFPVDGARLSDVARRILDRLGVGAAELSLLLVADRRMRVLNREHRRVNRPTDVLSFPMYGGTPEQVTAQVVEEAESMRDTGDAPPLGDLVISVETAYRQAQSAGISPEAELTVLTVHGILHLIGHDHEQGGAQAARMGMAERDMLQHLGMSPAGLLDRTNEPDAEN